MLTHSKSCTIELTHYQRIILEVCRLSNCTYLELMIIFIQKKRTINTLKIIVLMKITLLHAHTYNIKQFLNNYVKVVNELSYQR